MTQQPLPPASRQDPIKHLLFACLIYSAVIAIAGLWPFDFLPENRVTRPTHGNGLIFDGRGIVLSTEPGRELFQDLFANKAITIELWVMPTGDPSNGVASILALYDSRNQKNFFVGQWRSHLIVRTQADQQFKERRDYREIGLREALAAGKERFITITTDPHGTTVYLEGKLVRTYPNHSVFCEPCGVGQLVLGNSPTGKQGWSGKLLGLGIYDRCLTSDEVVRSQEQWEEDSRKSFELENTVALYMFEEGYSGIVRNHAMPGLDLSVPKRFVPPQKIVLSRSWNYIQHGWSSVRDILVNLVGFMPFGLLLSALLLRTNLVSKGLTLAVTTLSGIALSLAIEVAQSCLPTRDSSLIDAACNGFGTALGSMVGFWPLAQRVIAKWL